MGAAGVQGMDTHLGGKNQVLTHFVSSVFLLKKPVI